MGVHIGTAYFVVRPHEIEEIIQWFLDVRKTHKSRIKAVETVYLQIRDSRIMLALSAVEIEDLWEVLQQGFVWANSFIPMESPPVAEAVH